MSILRMLADVETSILPGDWGIEDILNLVLNIIVYGLGVAAVLGVIIAGVMYMTARDWADCLGTDVRSAEMADSWWVGVIEHAKVDLGL